MIPARACVLAAAAACAVVAWLAPARDARAGGTVIITDDGVAQYKETTKALKARLSGTVTVVDLGDDDPVASARRASPDVIVTVGQKALTLVSGRVTDVPVVYCTVLYPDKHGLTGKNITGVPLEVPAEKQLKRFREVAPSAKRMGVIYSKDSGSLVEEAQAAAKALGVTIVAKAVTSSRDVGDAFDDLKGRVDALWLLPDAKVISKDVFAYLLRESLDEGIPLFGFLEGFTQAGALASIAPDYADIGARAASLVKVIQDGGAGDALPAKVYSNGALSINLKTAQRLSIDVDSKVKKAAAKIFE